VKEARLFLFVLFTHDWPFMLCPFAFNLNETNTHSFPFHLFCFILNAKETKFTSLFVLLLRLIVMERGKREKHELNGTRTRTTNATAHSRLKNGKRKKKERRVLSFHFITAVPSFFPFPSFVLRSLIILFFLSLSIQFKHK